MKSRKLKADDLLLCNCADCDCELLGESQVAVLEALNVEDRPALARRLGFVAGRLDGRPFCGGCLVAGRIYERKRKGTR